MRELPHSTATKSRILFKKYWSYIKVNIISPKPSTDSTAQATNTNLKPKQLQRNSQTHTPFQYKPQIDQFDLSRRQHHTTQPNYSTEKTLGNILERHLIFKQ